jgi:hypothetical protein
VIGLVSLGEETGEKFLHFCTQYMREPGREPSPDSNYAGTVLNNPTFRTMRNKCLFLGPPAVELL